MLSGILRDVFYGERDGTYQADFLMRTCGMRLYRNLDEKRELYQRAGWTGRTIQVYNIGVD